MKKKYRPIKKYKPRRRRSNKELQRQQIQDFKHLLEMDLSSLLILKKEGTPRQAQLAKEKARSDLLKYGFDMENIGKDLGQGFPQLIGDYIKSMRKILQNAVNDIDPSLINAHRKRAEELKKSASGKRFS